MKRASIILIIILAAWNLNPAFGQDHQTVKLATGSKILKAMSVNNGLVLLTGNEFYFRKNLNWKITYYAPHLTARYEVPVPKPSIASLYNSFFVVSPSGKNVYLVRRGAGGLMGSPNTQDIFHIDSAGISNSLTLKKELTYSNVNVVFADDDYLYYVTKERNKKNKHDKHAFPKLQFVKVGKDKSVSKVLLALPDPDPDATEWSYLGNTTVVSYFVSRTLDDENYKEQKFRIAVIDHDGKLLDDFKIDANLTDGKFMAEYNYCGNLGTHEADNHNIKTTTYTSTSYNANGTSTTTTTTFYSPYPEAYGNIMLDPITNGFYVYGISGSEPAGKESSKRKKDNIVPSGYYVYKFDQDGKEIWKNEGKLTGIDDFYKNKASFMSRNVTLEYGAQGNLRLQAFAGKNVDTYEINPQSGKFVINYSNTFDDAVSTIDLSTCHKSGDKTDLSKFLSKPGSGQYSQLNFRMLNNNIVVRNFYEDSKLDLYSFGDE